MKHPRMIGVSINFQNWLLEYSPALYEKLSKDAVLRRIFYSAVKNRSTTKAFNERYTLYKDAQALVERLKQFERARKAEGVDNMQRGKKKKERAQNDKALELAHCILNATKAKQMRRPTQGELAKSILALWTKEYQDKPDTVVAPLSMSVIVKALSRENLPRSYYT